MLELYSPCESLRLKVFFLKPSGTYSKAAGLKNWMGGGRVSMCLEGWMFECVCMSECTLCVPVFIRFWGKEWGMYFWQGAWGTLTYRFASVVICGDPSCPLSSLGSPLPYILDFMFYIYCNRPLYLIKIVFYRCQCCLFIWEISCPGFSFCFFLVK